MSKYTVIVSKRVDEMLIRHVRFLAQVRVSAAKWMVAEFAKVLDTLEENPFQFLQKRTIISRSISQSTVQQVV